MPLLPIPDCPEWRIARVPASGAMFRKIVIPFAEKRRICQWTVPTKRITSDKRAVSRSVGRKVLFRRHGCRVEFRFHALEADARRGADRRPESERPAADGRRGADLFLHLSAVRRETDGRHAGFDGTPRYALAKRIGHVVPGKAAGLQSGQLPETPENRHTETRWTVPTFMPSGTDGRANWDYPPSADTRLRPARRRIQRRIPCGPSVKSPSGTSRCVMVR